MAVTIFLKTKNALIPVVYRLPLVISVSNTNTQKIIMKLSTKLSNPWEQSIIKISYNILKDRIIPLF